MRILAPSLGAASGPTLLRYEAKVNRPSPGRGKDWSEALLESLILGEILALTRVCSQKSTALKRMVLATLSAVDVRALEKPGGRTSARAVMVWDWLKRLRKLPSQFHPIRTTEIVTKSN
jgi:hypothetical protein